MEAVTGHLVLLFWTEVQHGSLVRHLRAHNGLQAAKREGARLSRRLGSPYDVLLVYQAQAFVWPSRRAGYNSRRRKRIHDSCMDMPRQYRSYEPICHSSRMSSISCDLPSSRWGGGGGRKRWIGSQFIHPTTPEYKKRNGPVISGLRSP